MFGTGQEVREEPRGQKVEIVSVDKDEYFPFVAGPAIFLRYSDTERAFTQAF